MQARAPPKPGCLAQRAWRSIRSCLCVSRPRPKQGARLGCLRRAAGLTQAKLSAHAIGETQQTSPSGSRPPTPRLDCLPARLRSGVRLSRDLLGDDPVVFERRRSGPVGRPQKVPDDARKLTSASAISSFSSSRLSQPKQEGELSERTALVARLSLSDEPSARRDRLAIAASVTCRALACRGNAHVLAVSLRRALLLAFARGSGQLWARHCPPRAAAHAVRAMGDGCLRRGSRPGCSTKSSRAVASSRLATSSWTRSKWRDETTPSTAAKRLCTGCALRTSDACSVAHPSFYRGATVDVGTRGYIELLVSRAFHARFRSHLRRRLASASAPSSKPVKASASTRRRPGSRPTRRHGSRRRLRGRRLSACSSRASASVPRFARGRQASGLVVWPRSPHPQRQRSGECWTATRPASLALPTLIDAHRLRASCSPRLGAVSQWE